MLLKIALVFCLLVSYEPACMRKKQSDILLEYYASSY